MAGKQLTHQIYIEQFNEFRTQGDRFTYEDGEQLKDDMLDLVGECKASAQKIQELELDIARLPPSKWQERILRMENELHELRTLMRMGNGYPGKSLWPFKGSGEPEVPFRADADLGITPMGITGADRHPTGN